MTRLIGYKYHMNHPNSRFTISSFLTFIIYIFSKSISLKYHYTFSFYKITDFIIEEFSHPSNETFYKYIYQASPSITTTTSDISIPNTTSYYHNYWLPWFTRHHLLLVTNLLDFPYEVTRHLE